LGSKKFHFLGEQKKLIRIYARERKGLGSNWSRTLVNIKSKRGVVLAVRSAAYYYYYHHHHYYYYYYYYYHHHYYYYYYYYY